MAEGTQTAATCDSGKTLQGLAIVAILLLAIFMVTSLNKIRAELVKLNQMNEELLRATAANAMSRYQIVTPDGDAQFRFALAPAEAGAAGSAAGTSGGPGSSGARPMPASP